MSNRGVGFLFPKVYLETAEKAKAGVLGEEIRKFFENHPDGAINAEKVTLCCDSCGNLMEGQDLSMHVPNENYNRGVGTQVPEGSQYFMEDDLEEDFTKFADYPHKCIKCGGSMHVVRSDENLFCPECGTPMEIDPDSLMMWD